MVAWYALARERDLSGAVQQLLLERQVVRLDELTDALEPYMPVRGTETVYLAESPNVVIWRDVSAEFAELLTNEIGDGRMQLELCPVFIYRGRELNLPAIAGIPEPPLVTPHWLPCLIRACGHP